MKKLTQALLVVVFIAILAAIAFLYFHFRSITTNENTYLSELTLVVTLVAVFAALFSLAGVYATNRAIEFATTTEERTRKHEELLASIHQKLESDLFEVEGYLASLRSSAAAFHPSGLFLAQRIRAIADAISHDWVIPKEVERALAGVMQQLAYAIEQNAEFGAQVQKLFVGSSNEVRASSLYLSTQTLREYANRLLQMRLELEKALPQPDLDLVEFLSFQLGAAGKSTG